MTDYQSDIAQAADRHIDPADLRAKHQAMYRAHKLQAAWLHPRLASPLTASHVQRGLAASARARTVQVSV